MIDVDENPQLDIDEDMRCGNPCPPHNPCEDCIGYWEEMKEQGFWKDGEGWTDKAIKEWSK